MSDITDSKQTLIFCIIVFKTYTLAGLEVNLEIQKKKASAMASIS